MTFKDQINYNCNIVLDNDQEFKVYANWLHNNNLDHWRGWKCAAGKTKIAIDADLNVYSGECRNDYLGNILTGWDLLNNGTICKRDRCTGCTDDLIVKKYKGE